MNKQTKIPKRSSKHSPMEISSKKPVGRFRQIIDPLRKVPMNSLLIHKDMRDPRFDPLSGSFNPHLFQRSYGDHIQALQQSEIQSLKSKSAKTKDPQEKSQLDSLVQSMSGRIASRKAQEQREAIKRDWKKQEIERVKEGKKPFYLKESDLKKLELIKKYEKVQATGGSIDKVLEKRRKKNASREHRMMPFKRRSQ